MPNLLAGESSPYLLQHKDNPVDWHPWGAQALALARAQDRPLLVSIGYSACHWCHVMERESFEDPEIAALMNAHFVCVKVDREEHPDVDALCMEACQAITGQGGWPLNAFLTPELVPFYAGTYFPPDQRGGRPSWRMVLGAVAEAWERRREEIRAQGGRVLESLSAIAHSEPSSDPISGEQLTTAIDNVIHTFDPVNGGFGAEAPKFPQAMAIELLLARGQPEPALATLRAMAAGGIYDQVGGGFSRYAVDTTWTVPHFEKMLYDNALLARAYLHGWQVSGEERMREVCCETLDFALRELRGPEGGFCSSLDADSAGVEGKFYVWSTAELREALGELSDEAIAYFGASDGGNFEPGLNVLEARGPRPETLPEIRRRLYLKRSERVRPGLDDKRLTGWNALMIAALAEAGAVLERDDYLGAARDCASFLLSKLRTDEGLMRTWKDGKAHIPAYLDDHAYMLEALLTLYEASFEPRWYGEAVGLAGELLARFSDPERGGFFTTSEAHEELPVRGKDVEDSPIPSGNSSAAFGLLRLALLSGEGDYERRALGVMRIAYQLAVRQPLAFSHLLRAADLYLAPVKEVAIVGPPEQARELVRVVRARLRPHLVRAGGSADGVPLLQGRTPVDGRASAYVCEHFICRSPVTSTAALEAEL